VSALLDRLKKIGSVEMVDVGEGVMVEVRGLKAKHAMEFLSLAQAAGKETTPGALNAATVHLVAHSAYEPGTGTFLFGGEAVAELDEIDNQVREKLSAAAMRLSGLDRAGQADAKNERGTDSNASSSESPATSEG
jgi:hypothetical protein